MSSRTGEELRAHDRVALGAAAGAITWVAILVVLNITTNPLVSAAACLACAWLCVEVGHRRLVVIALLSGVGMCLLQPGIARVDGSFAFVYESGAWQRPGSVVDWLRIVASTTRFPAQVLATVLLVLVPAELLLAAAGRISARGALLGGLAARLRPLLERDARLVRDELASRGVQTASPAPIGARARGMVAVWEALVSGLVDRAFVTAAALRTRGYGVACTPTIEPLRDARLVRGARRRASLDRTVVACGVGAMLAAGLGRATGQLGAPRLELFGGYDEPITLTALVVAGLVAAGPLVLVRVARRGDATDTGHVDVASGRGVAHAAAPVLATVGVEPRVVADEQPVLLALRDVSVHYPDAARPSLDRITLDVHRGELVVLVGPSGSGKSTLLDALTGVAPIVTGGERSGSIRLADRILVGGDDEAGRVAAVFQQPETQVIIGVVAEEVAFGLRQAGHAIEVIEQRVIATLEWLGVLHLARRDCSTLSGGELQRVLLAAALAMEPDLLVLDEPTSQVDATSELRFWNAVDAARRDRGIAVIVAEHRIEQLRLRADRILGVVDGRLMEDVDDAALADRVLDDLVPAPPRHGAPRLSIRIDRLGVGEALRVVARGITADLPAGAIVTLEGPNGSGKSTLLRAVRGLHPVDGDVRVDGIARVGVAGSVHLFAWLSQAAGVMLPGRTVRDAVTAGRPGPRHDAAAVVARLQGAGLGDRLESHPSELSVGERQRLALVAATAHGAPIWLLDEPTRGMDPAARRWVALQMLAHAAAGGVVVVATHDSQLAAAVATHRLRLDLRTGPSLVRVRRDGAGRVVTPATPATTSSLGEVAP